MKIHYFYPEKPKLINIDQPLLDTLSKYSLWVAEKKYNGSRLQLHVDGGEFELWNRHGKQFDYRPSGELKAALIDFVAKTKGYCLFDGELRHNKVTGVRDKIVLWDVFMWDGTLLVNGVYGERRRLFPETWSENLHVTDQADCLFRSLFHDWIQDKEIEGMVIKNINGRLNLGRSAGQHSDWMFKVRRPNNSYRF